LIVGSLNDSTGSIRDVLCSVPAEPRRIQPASTRYKPPHIKKLITEGVRIDHANNVFPMLTAPNMASLVTGSYPRTTGIAANPSMALSVT